jgi:hypothetical protein
MFAVGLGLFALAYFLDAGRDRSGSARWYVALSGVSGVALMLASVLILSWRWLP